MFISLKKCYEGGAAKDTISKKIILLANKEVYYVNSWPLYFVFYENALISQQGGRRIGCRSPYNKFKIECDLYGWERAM